MHKTMKKKAGFTLVEVMVAVLVLAIGLIGLAGLQVAGLRSNQSAYYRSVATQLAYDMADRMRANRVGVENGHYNLRAADDENEGCQGAGASCDAGQLAGYDIASWNKDLAAKLAGATGIVCLASDPKKDDPANPAGSCDGSGEDYAIMILWNDEWWDRTGVIKRLFVIRFRP